MTVSSNCETEPPVEEPLTHVGWWCWRGDNHGHLATMACRSDNVPIHVPAEWADEMRAVIQQIEDGDDESEPAVVSSPPATDRATVRDRIRRVLAQSDGFDFDSLEPHDYQIQAAAILAALPPDTETQLASTAPLAAGLPLVQGTCPACHSTSLFLGNGGYVTCSRIDCPEPDAATTVLERQPAGGAGGVADETGEGDRG